MRMEAGSFVECVEAIVSGNGIEPGSPEDFGQGIGDQALVVDDKNLCAVLLIAAGISGTPCRSC